MSNYSRNDVILVSYPFTDLSATKVRPAIIAGLTPSSSDIIIVPLTSRASTLLDGEFVLSDWGAAGLNVASVVKRGAFTIQVSLIMKTVGKLSNTDIKSLDNSLRVWLSL